MKATATKRNEIFRKNRREEECGRTPDRLKTVPTANKLSRRNKNVNGEMHNGLHRTGKVSTDEIIEALVAENGMLTLAAKRLKISYNTLKKYIGKNPKVQEAIIEIEEYQLDTVQKRLYEMIKEGNSGSIYFYLKCKGKSRGFIESAQHQQLPSQPITFNYKLVLPNHTEVDKKDVIDIVNEKDQKLLPEPGAKV